MPEAFSLETPVTTSTTPAPAGHDAAMVAKVEASAAAAAGQPPVATVAVVAQRPEHIPEKFWDAAKGEVRLDDLAKSYTAIEKGKPSAAPTNPADPALAITPQADAAAVVGQDAFAAYSKEFSETGKLSAESYTALEGKGIPKAMVDQYVAGAVALAASARADGLAAAGGEEAFGKMSTWASSNLTEAEIATYNQSVEGTPEQRKQAITALRSRYEAAYGSSQSGMAGGEGNANPTHVQPYASQSEVTADMRNPKYANDPAFRRQVEMRLSVTP